MPAEDFLRFDRRNGIDRAETSGPGLAPAIDLPQVKSEQGKALLKVEYDRFRAAVEDLTGVAITVDSMKAAIRTVDAKRAAIYRRSTLRKADPAPISGLDALLANQKI